MALMAIDHASVLAGRLHWSEFWGITLPDYGDSLVFFLTRFLTHFCAPGFFFFLGIGIVLLAHHRLDQGWDDVRIRRHLLIRGVILIIVQQLLENPAWLLGFSAWAPGEFRGSMQAPGDGSSVYLNFSVLFTLALCLIAGSFLWQRTIPTLLGIAVTALLLTYWFLPSTEAFSTRVPVLLRLLVVPGLSNHVNVLYPLLPWLAVTCFGIIYGKLILLNDMRLLHKTFLAALVMIATFVLIRMTPWGDSARTDSTGIIGFLSVTKYPPSIEFILVTIAGNLLLLCLWQKVSPLIGRLAMPLTVFGQCALFFYIAHLYIFSLMAYTLSGQPSLWIIYGIWMIGLIILFALCHRYAQFKHTRPTESVWRFF